MSSVQNPIVTPCLKLRKDPLSLKELRRKKVSARCREAALGTQTRWEDGEQAGAKAGCWGDVDTYGEKQGGRLVLSTSWLRGSADRQAKANISEKAAVVY